MVKSNQIKTYFISLFSIQTIIDFVDSQKIQGVENISLRGLNYVIFPPGVEIN